MSLCARFCYILHIKLGNGQSHPHESREQKVKISLFYVYFGQKNIIFGQHVRNIMEESLHRTDLKGGSRTWENIGYQLILSPFPEKRECTLVLTTWIDACLSQ